MRSTFKVLFYLKRNKCKDQKVVPVMGRITVNGSIAQFSAKLSVPETLWEVSGGRAKGRSLEADRINRHLDNIRTQIGKHYQDICDRESYVTAEKVKNAYLGFGEKYRLLLEAFEKFTGDLKKRVGIDRCYGTWNRYYKSIDHLRTFMRKEYNVSDMPLAELEQSFIEQYHVYLKSNLGLKPTTVSGYLKCLKYVIKIAFNNGWMPRNPFSLYQYTAPQRDRGVFVTVCSVGLGSRLQQHDCDQKCELSNWVILLNVVTTRSAPCPRSGGIRWRARSGGSRRIPGRPTAAKGARL